MFRGPSCVRWARYIRVGVPVQPQHRAHQRRTASRPGSRTRWCLRPGFMGLGQQQLELAAVQGIENDGVAVLVDEWDVAELVSDAH